MFLGLTLLMKATTVTMGSVFLIYFEFYKPTKKGTTTLPSLFLNKLLINELSICLVQLVVIRKEQICIVALLYNNCKHDQYISHNMTTMVS